MQDVLVAGDTLDFEKSITDFPASEGWTLTYALVPQSIGGTPVAFTAAASGDAYRVLVGPTVTRTWTAGNYTWSAFISAPGERYTVDEGTCIVRPDPATASTLDGRSFAQRMLDAVEAALERNGRVAEYEINGRRMKYVDLLSWRTKLKNEVWRENAAKTIADGGGNPRNIRVRFLNA